MRRRKILILLLIAAGVLVVVWYRGERQEDRVMEWLEDVAAGGSGSVADFQAVDWIEWDAVCVIGPYVSGNRVGEIIGAKWRWGTSGHNDNQQLIVFMRGGAGGQKISRSIRYSNTTHFHVDPRCYTREEARFVLKEDSMYAHFEWALQ